MNFAGGKIGLSYNTRRWRLEIWDSNQMSLCENFYTIALENGVKYPNLYKRNTISCKMKVNNKELIFPQSIISLCVAKC